MGAGGASALAFSGTRSGGEAAEVMLLTETGKDCNRDAVEALAPAVSDTGSCEVMVEVVLLTGTGNDSNRESGTRSCEVAVVEVMLTESGWEWREGIDGNWPLVLSGMSDLEECRLELLSKTGTD